MELDERTARELLDWLLGREASIAFGEEDFDELRDVFEAVVGRRARCSLTAAGTPHKEE